MEPFNPDNYVLPASDIAAAGPSVLTALQSELDRRDDELYRLVEKAYMNWIIYECAMDVVDRDGRQHTP